MPITLPYGPDAGDTLISLALNTIDNIYVSGTLYGPEIQIDTESYSRFYVRSSASRVYITAPHVYITSCHVCFTSNHVFTTLCHVYITSCHVYITSCHMCFTSHQKCVVSYHTSRSLHRLLYLSTTDRSQHVIAYLVWLRCMYTHDMFLHQLFR